MLRAAWMAQELLATFDEEVGEVSLRPDHTGGVFKILIDDEVIFVRTIHSGFPDIKELKQLVRDKIAPGKDLGHSDRT
jgi:selenoprotein W-related protein